MKKILIAFQLIISTILLSQTVDENFKPQILRSGILTGVEVLPDDRILVFGNINYIISGNVRNKIVKIGLDGTLDNTFNLDKKVIGDLYGCKVDELGNIYIYGRFTDLENNFVTGLYRLNANGTIDDSFKKVDYDQLSINEIKFYKDGKLLINYRNPSNNNTGLILLNGDGTINEDFNKVLNLSTAVLDISQTDQIILHDNNMSLIELKLYDSSGNFVKQLTTNMPYGQIIDVEILDSGNIVLLIAGNTIHLLDSDGTLLHTTKLGESFSYLDNIFEIKELSSNIITGIGSKIYEYNSINKQLNVLNNIAFDVPYVNYAKKSNDELICVGSFKSFNNQKTDGIIYIKKELNAYKKNPSYTTAIYSFGNVYSIEKDNTGNIYLGGSFTKVNEEEHYNMVKLKLNGDINSTFNAKNSVELGTTVLKINFHEDKLVIGSSHTQFTPFDKVKGLSFMKHDGQFIANVNYPYVFSTGSIPLLNSTSNNDFIAIEGGSVKNGNKSMQTIVKYNSSGTQTSYYSDLYLKSVGLIHDALINEEDELLLVGHQIEYDDGDTSCIVMINEDGSRKKSFNPSLPINYRCLAGAFNDDFIYASGVIMSGYLGVGGFMIKLDKGGNKILDFNVNVTSFDSSNTNVDFIMPLSKNKILISGSFDFCNGNRVLHNNAIVDSAGNFISDINLFSQTRNALKSYIKEGNDFYIVGDIISDFGAIGAIKLKNIETTTEDKTLDNVSIFPNPTNKVFRINTDVDVIEIYNSLGQLLEKYTNYEKNTSLELDEEKGIFIVKGLLSDGIHFAKTVVKN